MKEERKSDHWCDCEYTTNMTNGTYPWSYVTLDVCIDEKYGF